MKVLPILVFIAMLGACATENPMYRPQPNEFSGKIPVERCEFEGDFAHICTIFNDLATLTPTNPKIDVSWDLIPENDSRPAKRNNCKISVRNAHGLESSIYRCIRVERIRNDFLVTFSVKTEKGTAEKELNLSSMPGGFSEGGFYEVPVAGFPGVRYGSRSSKPLRVVWSTHEPIRSR